MKKIPLIKPYITKTIKDRVCAVLDSGYLTEGPVTREFEQSVRDYIGCRYALAVCNCTVGLEMALRALGIGPGDEVIVPDYTYPATASVVEIVGAKIVIVDIDRETMLIDFEELEKAITPATRAIIPVSIFGNPLDYERLAKIKESHNLYVIEDAACSLGAKYGRDYVGNLADISVFSLHPRKFITTGEGGMITTHNKDWANWMESYKHFGMVTDTSRGEVEFERIGTNYKLSNIQAAVGLEQMKHIDTLLAKRTERVQQYKMLLAGNPGVVFPRVTEKSRHSWQSFCVFVDRRNEIIRRLGEKNIETQIGTYALHMHKAFRDNSNCRINGNMLDSRYAFEHCLTLPLFHDMSDPEQEEVVRQLLALTEGK